MPLAAYQSTVVASPFSISNSEESTICESNGDTISKTIAVKVFSSVSCHGMEARAR